MIAWLTRALRSLAGAAPTLEPVDPLVEAGWDAFVNALHWWEQDIFDPRPGDRSDDANRCRSLIQEIIRDCWPEHVYRGDRAGAEWCVMFWRACWTSLVFSPAENATYFPSTYRVSELWAGRSIFGVMCPVRPGRQRWTFDAHSTELPPGCEPRAGDLLVVGDGSPRYGDHACLVESYDATIRRFRTVEGNAVGLGPRGNRRQGVIRGSRPLGKRAGEAYYALALYRPSVEDLAPF